jgi:hypothetical protein
MLPRSFQAASLVALLSFAGCVQRYPSRDAREPQPPAQSSDAVAALEARLQGAPSVRLKFSIVSRGVVQSSFEGSLLLERSNRVRLDANGTLDQKPSRPSLVSDGRKMQGGSADKSFASDTAPALGDAVLLGLTRTGLLQNLIVLAGGAPPDGADGSIQTFAQVNSVARGANEPVNGVEAERYDFKVVVRGKPMGDATLWIDPRSGLPLKRHQAVHFPDGELTVDETYEAVGVGGAVEPNAFDVSPPPVEI